MTRRFSFIVFAIVEAGNMQLRACGSARGRGQKHALRHTTGGLSPFGQAGCSTIRAHQRCSTSGRRPARLRWAGNISGPVTVNAGGTIHRTCARPVCIR